MKKILYGTTALLAAGMISSAANAAEPLKLQLGGFADWMVGYADQDGQFEATQGTTKYNAVDVRGDVEVHFKGESQLDNGLTVITSYSIHYTKLYDLLHIVTSGISVVLQSISAC